MLVVTYLDMYQIIKEFIRNVVQRPGMLPMPWSIYIKAFLSKIFSMRDHGQELVWYISSYTLCWRCIYSLTSACISILTTDNWILRILTKRKTFSKFFSNIYFFANNICEFIFDKNFLKEFSIPEMNQGKHLMVFWCFFCQDETSTLFLIAGYARYSCPYVWIRSNHQRLVKLMGEVETEKDSPLRLKSTASWKDRSMTCCNSQHECCTQHCCKSF